ncbi:MAG TPA: hypothetical protein VGC41_20345 [Kofleriaceae bacterium]
MIKIALVASLLAPAVSFAGDAPKADAKADAAKKDDKAAAKTDAKKDAKTPAKKDAATPAKKDAATPATK